MAAPAVPTPAAYFALTRVLVVPSVWKEPFGRVAAEAMINAIPPLVSNRGSLPQVVGGDFREGGGGRVLPVPDWMTFSTTTLPSEPEVEPWFEAMCGLEAFDALAVDRGARARDRGRRYSEDVSRKKRVRYCTTSRDGSGNAETFDRQGRDRIDKEPEYRTRAIAGLRAGVSPGNVGCPSVSAHQRRTRPGFLSPTRPCAWFSSRYLLNLMTSFWSAWNAGPTSAAVAAK